MIDDPHTVASSIDRMHGHLPIPAFPTRDIVQLLGRRGVKVSVERTLSVKHVFYAGDEASIVCDVTPTRDAKEVVVVSLTHLRIAPNHPLYSPILGYQRERVRRLALADP